MTDITENKTQPIIAEEIVKLNATIEQMEHKINFSKKLMLTLPILGTSMGLFCALCVALYESLENLTIHNFMVQFTNFKNLYPIYGPSLFGIYLSWAVATTDYKEIKNALNTATLQRYFLQNGRNKEITIQNDLDHFLKNLEGYGEQIPKCKKKYEKGQWSLEDRNRLAQNDIDSQTFENFLEEYTRKRKI